MTRAIAVAGRSTNIATTMLTAKQNLRREKKRWKRKRTTVQRATNPVQIRQTPAKSGTPKVGLGFFEIPSGARRKVRTARPTVAYRARLEELSGEGEPALEKEGHSI